MKDRKLGASDLLVSEISLGSWLTYGVGVERDNAIACVNRAFDLGITFIDNPALCLGVVENFLPRFPNLVGAAADGPLSGLAAAPAHGDGSACTRPRSGACCAFLS